MSKRSEEIAAQIKASREEAARVAEQFKQDQIALNEKLYVQNFYDIYVAGTQNAANGTNTHTTEKEKIAVVVKADTGRTPEGTPYARIIRNIGDPKYDDFEDCSVTGAYIIPDGEEKVTIAIVNSFMASEAFSVYSYDTKNEDSSLVLETKRGEPAPDEFEKAYNFVEGAISLNTQDVTPAE